MILKIDSKRYSSVCNEPLKLVAMKFCSVVILIALAVII